MYHEYPVSKKQTNEHFTPLGYLEISLKGTDAVLMKVCKELSLNATLQMVYHESDSEYGDVLILCPLRQRLRLPTVVYPPSEWRQGPE